MICQRCLHRASTRARLPQSIISPKQLQPPTHHPPPHRLTRALTTFTHPNSPQPTTSTSTAQFATPLTPTLPPTASSSSSTSSSAPKTTPTSSVPAGTPLRGLNYLKASTDPLALEDSAYPTWLWQCLDKAGTKNGGADSGDGDGVASGDLFSKSKKQRRIAAKKLRKLAAANPERLVPKVPVQEQSVDLWSGDGTVGGAVKAEEGRREVTRALRGVRRRGIKEGNFLRGMR